MKLLVAWTLVASATTVLDFVWARYLLAVAAKRALGAAAHSAIIFGISGSVAMAYIHEHTMLIPAVIGSFAGTFLGVRCKS